MMCPVLQRSMFYNPHWKDSMLVTVSSSFIGNTVAKNKPVDPIGTMCVQCTAWLLDRDPIL